MSLLSYHLDVVVVVVVDVVAIVVWLLLFLFVQNKFGITAIFCFVDDDA